MLKVGGIGFEPKKLTQSLTYKYFANKKSGFLDWKWVKRNQKCVK